MAVMGVYSFLNLHRRAQPAFLQGSLVSTVSCNAQAILGTDVGHSVRGAAGNDPRRSEPPSPMTGLRTAGMHASLSRLDQTLTFSSYLGQRFLSSLRGLLV